MIKEMIIHTLYLFMQYICVCFKESHATYFCCTTYLLTYWHRSQTFVEINIKFNLIRDI